MLSFPDWLVVQDDFCYATKGCSIWIFAGGNGTEKENFSTLMASSNTVATNSNLRWYWGKCIYANS